MFCALFQWPTWHKICMKIQPKNLQKYSFLSIKIRSQNIWQKDTKKTSFFHPTWPQLRSNLGPCWEPPEAFPSPSPAYRPLVAFGRPAQASWDPLGASKWASRKPTIKQKIAKNIKATAPEVIEKYQEIPSAYFRSCIQKDQISAIRQQTNKPKGSIG